MNTAMYEAIGDLERIVQGLQKPVDGDMIARRLQDESTRGHISRLSLEDYLEVGTLEPDLKGSTKEEAIEELLGILARRKLISDLDDATRAVWLREGSMSTGMQYGIAIPHGRTDAVKRLVCAVGLCREGLDFGSIDGKPTEIIVLALSPKSAAAPHLQFVAVVSHLLNEEGRQALLACKSARKMYRVLTRDLSNPDE